jgi:hypothetical protein
MIDPIDWLDGLFGQLFHGPLHRFTFSRLGDFTGVEVEKMLQQYGVRVWGREADKEEIGILVKESQAIWAEYLLCRAGVPLTCKLLDARNAQYREQHPRSSMPIAWTERGIGLHSLVDHIVDWLDRRLG